MAMMSVGTAGWSLSRETAASFPGDGQHLQRYACVLDCAEINSSFYRSHRFEVYQRWAAITPTNFRFSVKLPRAITHDGRLRRAREPLKQFMSEVAGLGPKCAVILVQLPPSLAFEARPTRNFFRLLSAEFQGSVVCEPRHASWFTSVAERVLCELHVSRVAADPARPTGAGRPGGWLGTDGDGDGATLYYRWHGSPRRYWSRYSDSWLRDRAHEMRRWPKGADCWCIFDNTASGSAIANALELSASSLEQ